MPLARQFRHGLPSGPNGEERPIQSNFPRDLNPKRPAPLTPVVPAEPVAEKPAQAAPVARSMAVTPLQFAERRARMARSGTPNLGGTMTHNGVTTTVAPSPSVPQQTERANPLTGDGGPAQTEGTTDAINPGTALGLNRRGTNTPQGMDASPSSNIGGTGLYARKFSNPKSAGVYDSYVKKLFPGSPV